MAGSERTNPIPSERSIFIATSRETRKSPWDQAFLVSRQPGFVAVGARWLAGVHLALLRGQKVFPLGQYVAVFLFS